MLRDRHSAEKTPSVLIKGADQCNGWAYEFDMGKDGVIIELVQVLVEMI